MQNSQILYTKVQLENIEGTNVYLPKLAKYSDFEFSLLNLVLVKPAKCMISHKITKFCMR